MEDNHQENARQLESLQSELSIVQSQQNKVDDELGGRRDDLASRERQLRVRNAGGLL